MFRLRWDRGRQSFCSELFCWVEQVSSRQKGSSPGLWESGRQAKMSMTKASTRRQTLKMSKYSSSIINNYQCKYQYQQRAVLSKLMQNPARAVQEAQAFLQQIILSAPDFYNHTQLRSALFSLLTSSFYSLLTAPPLQSLNSVEEEPRPCQVPFSFSKPNFALKKFETIPPKISSKVENKQLSQKSKLQELKTHERLVPLSERSEADSEQNMLRENLLARQAQLQKNRKVEPPKRFAIRSQSKFTHGYNGQPILVKPSRPQLRFNLQPLAKVGSPNRRWQSEGNNTQRSSLQRSSVEEWVSLQKKRDKEEEQQAMIKDLISGNKQRYLVSSKSIGDIVMAMQRLPHLPRGQNKVNIFKKIKFDAR